MTDDEWEQAELEESFWLEIEQLRDRIGVLEAHRDSLFRAAERVVEGSGVSFDDERIEWIEVQVERDDWNALVRAVKGGG